MTNITNKINSFIDKINGGEDKDEIIKRVKYKGLYILERIYSFLESENISEITWNKINSIFVYDKRIRNLLFKYIALIEEYYRAILYNNWVDDEEKCTKLEKTNFNQLISKLKENNVINSNKEETLMKIKSLRNNCCHHSFILLNNNQINNKTIENIILMKELLPEPKIQNTFVEELINAETKSIDPQKYKNTEFDLVDSIKLSKNKLIKEKLVDFSATRNRSKRKHWQ